MSRAIGLLALATLALTAPARAQFTAAEIPVSGATDAVFDSLDLRITEYLADNQITACVVGIMADHRVVYERGFGWHDYPGGDLTPVAEDDVMRVASVTKVITAAAIQKAITDGLINATDKVFEYAAPGGLLPAATYYPHNGVLGDSRLADITVQDLLLHRGGFDPTVNASPWNGKAYDPQFSSIRIANEIDPVNPPLPPGAVNTVRFMMRQPLQFDPGADATPSSYTFTTATSTPAGDEPRGIAVGDLNADGIPDLVTGNWLSDNVSVKAGIGDGTFAAGITLAVGTNPQGVAIGDLDHDDKPDIVVANNGDNEVGVILRAPGGGFVPVVAYATGGAPTSVLIEDMNGDTHPDILVAAYGGNKVWVHLGNGDGTFQPGTGYAAQNGTRTLAVGDMDRDGNLDIICANSSSDSISMFLGAGDGTFGSAINIATGDGPFGVAVADLDGNGWLDVITANETSDDFSVHLETAGVFDSVVSYPAGNTSRGLFVADLNGDGMEDVVTADHDDDTVSFYLGNGDGTFGPRFAIVVGISPYYVTGDDLNGDGQIDLACANRGTDNASVILQIPNGTHSYSNFGYMLLGLILDQVTGDHLQYIQDNFLTTWGGTSRDLFPGETFREDQDPREPFYDGPSNAKNVFCNPVTTDCNACPCVDWAYGGWDHAIFLGHGDLVMNTVQILQYADRYLGYSIFTTNPAVEIGTPLAGWLFGHNGSIDGTNALLSNGIFVGGVEHADNVRLAIIMNDRYTVDGNQPYIGIQTILTDFLTPREGQMPATNATDTWVDFLAGGGGDGSFPSPMSTVNDALPLAQENGRIKIKPGSTTWTGTINAPVRLDAPLGTARIGGP